MKPSERLVGLQYTKGTQAPVILFKAAGEKALLVLSLAKKYKVPVQKNINLLPFLYSLPEGSIIPEEQYLVVARILAGIYAMKERNDL